MGERLLCVTPNLIIQLLKGWIPNHRNVFEVKENAIPQDAKIISVTKSMYFPNTIEIVLESPTWEDAPPRTQINPVVSVTIE